jgi:NAD(P)-dependent dehydrogenase (short-subunit alcohol dehydrogenase family)
METNLIKGLFDVAGKVAIITGATGGLGHTASRGLAQAGVKVMLTGRNEKELQALLAEIEKEGGTAAYSVGNPTVHEDVIKVVKDTVDKFGGIDILVTAAGFNKPGSVVDQPVEEWQSIMDANVKGTWLYLKEVGKIFLSQNRGGKVVIVGSVRGEYGWTNLSAYNASKGAVHLMTKTMAWEWGKQKINVNAIAPTVFRTKLTQWIFDNPQALAGLLPQIPMGRLGEPEDFLGTIIFLSSKASDFMTGAIIPVDGGFLAG